MKNKTQILTFITYAVLLSAISVLINDMREFDLNQFKEFTYWAKTSDKSEPWFTSKNAVKWSFYAVSTGLFFWRAYLIYAFSYFLSILKELEEGNYFSDRNVSYFTKIGNMFIAYVINVLVLRFLLAFISESTFNLFNQLKNEFTLLIPCGLAFFILAELFKKAKQHKEENDLTI